MSQLGGNVEPCSVCGEKVYPLDRFVIEKLVMHKACFKCKSCQRKLSLTNFAAVNNTVYCKVHYLKLFREAGGKYDKAFGDGGFQKKGSIGYVPGQFTGVGKSAPVPAHLSATPVMSPVITPKSKPIIVPKLADDEDDAPTDDDEGAEVGTTALGEKNSSVKDLLQKYESSLKETSGSETDSQPSPVSKRREAFEKTSQLHGNADSRQKWLSGVSSANINKHAEVDESPGGSVAQRMAAYLATAGDASQEGSQMVEAEEEMQTSSFSTETKALSGSYVKSPETMVHSSLENRLKWIENLGSQHVKSHTEIDTSPGGSAQERREAYLAAASTTTGSPASTGSGSGKKVSKLVQDKMKVFATESSSASASSPRSPEPVGIKLEDKIKQFMEAASSSNASSPSTPVLVGRIDERLRPFEHSALDEKEHALDLDLQDFDVAPQVVASITLSKAASPKGELGQTGAAMRSFNEGANATLRRTPSWLRQQKAMEETSKAAGVASVEPSSQEPATSLEVAACNFDTLPQTPSKEETASGEEEEPLTPVLDLPAVPPTGSIMKRTGSFKKGDKSASPAEKRVVRFGAAEVHDLPSSPKTPEVSAPSLDVYKSQSSHSASKGSALAAYLKAVESGGGIGSSRKRALELPSPGEHAGHADSPPPPILSPGSRPPVSHMPSSLAKSFNSLDMLESADETLPSAEEQQSHGEATGETSEMPVNDGTTVSTLDMTETD